MDSRQREIMRLQKLRAPSPRNLSIAPIVQAAADHASRTQRKLGDLITLWEELLPEALASRTSITGLRGGVLHVIVDSSATAFEIDRLLRTGLLNQLRGRFRGTLVRVKSRIGQLT